jgi:hypothetical protein
MNDRRKQGTWTYGSEAKAFEHRALSKVSFTVAPPVHYPNGAVYGGSGGFTSNDANPNLTPPAADRILLGSPESDASPISHVAVWGAVTAATVLAVWVRTGLTQAGMAWARVARINLSNVTTDLEAVVAVGARDVFVQVESGATGGTPVKFAVAAC